MARLKVGTGKAAELVGLPALTAKINELMSEQVAKEVAEAVGVAADICYEQLVANARSVGLPEEAIGDIFTYKRPPPGLARSLVSALAGYRKRGRSKPWAGGYVEWRAGRHPKSPRAKAAPGTLIGESRGEMFEIGTTVRPATPWFRPAVTATKKAMLAKIAQGFSDILQRRTEGK